MRAQIFNFYFFMYFFFKKPLLSWNPNCSLTSLELRDLPVCLTSAGIKDLCHQGEPRNGEFLNGEWVAENTQCILHFKIGLH